MSDRLEQLLKFHEKDPTDTFTTYGIAMEYVKTQEWDSATAWLDKTLAIDGDYAYAYAYYQKAAALVEAGQEEEAKRAIDAGLTAAERSGDAKAAEELTVLRDGLE